MKTNSTTSGNSRSQGIRLFELADHIERDIRQRNLKPGDSYLSTAGTARLLGVSTTIANRALQLASSRRLIKRSQRSGAVVMKLDQSMESTIDRVYILVRQDHYKKEGLLADGTIIGIQQALPGASIQFSFTPEFSAEKHVEDLVNESLLMKQVAAFVMVRGSLPSQRILESSGLAAVVVGTPYPSIQRLSTLNRDNAQMAELLSTYMFNRGARRLLLMFRDDMLQGDYTAINRFHAVAAERGLRPTDLMLAGLPADPAAVTSVLRQFLDAGEQRAGIFCRSRLLAEIVLETLANSPSSAGEPPIVVVGDVFEAEPHSHPYAYVRLALSPQEIGRHIGRMLIRQVQNPGGGPHHERIPQVLES
ncbi:MAG: LacI family DNA-binding transcriptional regulator [Phycisphaeraceae bacterium]|nr:LacI family DNA-binding transcriptional regulator [Phycisphaeraceae bacterium]